MRIAFAIVCCAVACAACGNNPAIPDASPDPPPDAPSDAPSDAGPCGADRLVTGELVDFDSTPSRFMGVANARFTVEGMPGRTSTTAPNGRFEICAPATSSMIFDVDAPGSYLDGKAYIEAEMAGDSYSVSFRALTQARASRLYNFDASRGHVLVFSAGDRVGLSLSRAHDPALAGNDDGRPGDYRWTAGNAGRYVLFPNVDVSSPTLTLTGDFTTGPHEIPVAAGQLTLVAMVFAVL